jgi:hypothetical protein
MKRKIRFIECPPMGKFETPDQQRALSNRERAERMKQFIVAFFVCVAFSAVIDAAQRKIAYDRGGNIFIADVDGTHSKKIAEGT